MLHTRHQTTVLYLSGQALSRTAKYWKAALMKSFELYSGCKSIHYQFSFDVHECSVRTLYIKRKSMKEPTSKLSAFLHFLHRSSEYKIEFDMVCLNTYVWPFVPKRPLSFKISNVFFYTLLSDPPCTRVYRRTAKHIRDIDAAVFIRF